MGRKQLVQSSKVEIEHDELSGNTAKDTSSPATVPEEYRFTIGQFLAIAVRMNTIPREWGEAIKGMWH